MKARINQRDFESTPAKRDLFVLLTLSNLDSM